MFFAIILLILLDKRNYSEVKILFSILYQLLDFGMLLLYSYYLNDCDTQVMEK